ncbi:MAG: DUF6175 family protein [Spirochaetia bacterium]
MRKLSFILITITIFGLLFSCVTAPEPAAPETEEPQEIIYSGSGRSESLLAAMSAAKMDAVRQAVIDMIGAQEEAANQELLQEVLYNTRNPNAFVLTDTMEALRTDNIDGEYIYEINIQVDLDAVESTLNAHGLLSSGQTAEADTAQDAADDTATSTQAEQPSNNLDVFEDDYAYEPTDEERRIIRRYLNNMTFMVYFDEDSTHDEFLMEGAVGIANEYLLSQLINTINIDQIDAIREDRQMAYEEETGESVSMIQWIAQRLNADVYIELDAEIEGETRGGRHYGQTDITLSIFDASTAQQLGSVPMSSNRAFSQVSQDDAVRNALQSTIYRAMPIAVNQARSIMAASLQRGIAYTVTIMNTPDSRMMSRFRSRLSRDVMDLQTVSQSSEETIYEIRLIGSIEDLEDTIYDVSDQVPGMEGIYQVYLRGRAITFDTGM